MMRVPGRRLLMRRAMLNDVARWNVMIDMPTTSGCRSRISRSTVAVTRDRARMRSAIDTR